MGGVFTQLNAAQLAKRHRPRAERGRALHRAFPRARRGAPRLITLAGSDPTANAAAIFPAAAARQPVDLLRQAGPCAQRRRGLRRAHRAAIRWRALPATTSRQVAAATGSAPPRPPALIPVSAATVPRLAPPLSTSATAALRSLMSRPRRCRPQRRSRAIPRRHQRLCGCGAAGAHAGDGFGLSFAVPRRGSPRAVAPVVSELWGNQAGAARGAAVVRTADLTQARRRLTLDLFRDAPVDVRGLFDGGKV